MGEGGVWAVGAQTAVRWARRAVVAAGLVVLGLSAWGVRAMPQPDEVAAWTAEQAIEAANTWRQRGFPIRTSVTDQAFEAVWPDGRRVRLPLPPDRMYVAVAPYLTRTHPCRFHSISGCQGELAGRTVEVTVRDEQGRRLWQRTLTTLPNGFVELWLPRGHSLRVAVRMGELQGEGSILTQPGAPTCITTIRLTRG